MGNVKPTREEAFELLKEYNESDALIKHALAVEGVMVHFAKKYEEDEEKWGVIGLCHDLDYEKYPEQHCTKVVEILNDKGWDDEYINAIASHGYGLCSEIEPKAKMEKVLFTIDELTGLINAAAIMRPSKSIMDLERKSVKKKYKTQSFAAGVDRSVIEKGLVMLNESNVEMDLDTLIDEVISGMRSVAEDIGLKGNV